MKSLRRYNRLPKGSRAKIERIIKELRANHPGESRLPENSSGAKIFAVWASETRNR